MKEATNVAMRGGLTSVEGTIEAEANDPVDAQKMPEECRDQEIFLVKPTETSKTFSCR